MQKAKALFLAATLAALASGARADAVGNVGAANQTAHGTPPGASAHLLSVGLGVQNHERVDTSSDGTAQIVFLDTSTMTVGRNSAVTVDHFVYNPSAGAGSQGVALTKGVLRFVGGGVSHGDGAEIKTPAATIGLRGGTVIVSLSGDCAGMLVALQNGVAAVANRASSITLTQPGYGVCVPSGGGPIGPQFLVPPQTIARLNARLDSHAGQTGGAAIPPDDPDAHRRLGDNRFPDLAPVDLLYDLTQFSLGDDLVRGRTNVDNQPTPPRQIRTSTP